MNDLEWVKKRFGIIGESEFLNRVLDIAIKVSKTDLSVLITGENGSGKESFSKVIHHLSNRKNFKFIALNCGAIPEGTVDSELFGHKKGAFTGAIEDRKGYFEEVDGGTIFLDEIGDLPMSSQARLLRVLEYGEIIKVGSSKSEKVNVRVIAATNINLEDAIFQKKFREDLYYRLSTVPIKVPSLRERGRDILLLFNKFAGDFVDKYKADPILLNEDASEEILKFRFPGNIRQLKNLVEQLSLLEIDRVISIDTLLKYAPDEKNRQLVLSSRSESKKMEFDFLYKYMFQLKEELEFLKSIVMTNREERLIDLKEEDGLAKKSKLLLDFNSLEEQGSEYKGKSFIESDFNFKKMRESLECTKLVKRKKDKKN